MDSSNQPITETSLSIYFKDRVSECAQRYKPPPHEDTCWYLSTLLDRYGRSEQFFLYEDGRYALRPLALLYGDAKEATNERERCLMLQQLGDMALFLGALFPGRFTRRGIQQDYVVGMGGGAYDYLAENSRQNRHIFAELANTFTRMLELVANACSRENSLGVEDVMGLYQRWRQTRDPVVGNQLQAIGIDLSGSDSVH
jgi:hypothetical protein